MANKTWDEIMADQQAARLVVTAVLAAMGIPRKGEEIYTVEAPRLGFERTEHYYTEVTRKQAWRIEDCFRAMLPDYSAKAAGEYEVKEWDIEASHNGSLWLRIVSGMKGDEGTMAEVFCRTRLSCRIGKRGGLRAYVSGKKGSTRTLKGRQVLREGIQSR